MKREGKEGAGKEKREKRRGRVNKKYGKGRKEKGGERRSNKMREREKEERINKKGMYKIKGKGRKDK